MTYLQEAARSAVTVPRLAEMRARGEKIAMLTAYDASFAAACDAAGVDSVLIGDSLGNVLQGHTTTLPVTVADIAYHTASVSRGNKNALEHGRFETQCENRVSCVVVQKIGLRPLANACQRLASFRNFSVPAKHLGSPPCDIAKPIWRFFCFRFRTRTPGPPPFLSPNSTSPDSNAPE